MMWSKGERRGFKYIGKIIYPSVFYVSFSDMVRALATSVIPSNSKCGGPSKQALLGVKERTYITWFSKGNDACYSTKDLLKICVICANQLTHKMIDSYKKKDCDLVHCYNNLKLVQKFYNNMIHSQKARSVSILYKNDKKKLFSLIPLNNKKSLETLYF